MNASKKKGIALSLLLIGLGVAWLLNIYQVLPGVDWFWTGGLGLIGVLILALGGFNQLTIIIGPFLIIGSMLSILRQTGRLKMDLEVPILVICLGILLLMSHVLRLPAPKCSEGEEPKRL